MSGPAGGTLFADQRDAGMIHLAGSLVAALGIDTRKYKHGGTARPGESAYDWSAMRIDATAEMERLIREHRAATAEAATLRAERDEAQAEVRAMLEGRRDEEERARMRLLASLLAKVPHVAMGLYPRTFTALAGDLPPMGADPKFLESAIEQSAHLRAALLADLDALVALGLRGEVLP